ncbi:hypothetical protein QA646_17795 [Rhizobium sp. CB3090]|uniref:hypothetical protein n=1 Tax=Rhizobium sp. CB3090 TaxID=3039156 RepID=UPI0024B0598C|nr:hypothetical protein [Rhizobium sp. CB3090]WFU09099.1 hypothetical protein QA646_17795 [Rhizobium sp. CB3090]
MSADTSDIVTMKSKARARVSNGAALLSGIDGRSASARRYRDLCMSYADDLGGAANLSEADMSMVRTAAALSVKSEEMQAAIVRGEDISETEIVRISNACTRVLSALKKGKSKPKATSTRSLRDKLLANKAAA